MFPRALNPQSHNNLARCQHSTGSGRCRRFLAPMHATLCARHAAAQRDDSSDLTAILGQNLVDCRTATDIHAHLWNLSLALQQGRISPRRAAVLAYIHSLLLRTLPAIEQRTKPGSPQNHHRHAAPSPGSRGPATPRQQPCLSTSAVTDAVYVLFNAAVSSRKNKQPTPYHLSGLFNFISRLPRLFRVFQRRLERALRCFMSFIGMLHRLPGMFVRGLMIFFSVAYRRGTVRVRRRFVQFRSSLMGIVFHGRLSLASPRCYPNDAAPMTLTQSCYANVTETTNQHEYLGGSKLTEIAARCALPGRRVAAPVLLGPTHSNLPPLGRSAAAARTCPAALPCYL